jgi:hypothetical protein
LRAAPLHPAAPLHSWLRSTPSRGSEGRLLQLASRGRRLPLDSRGSRRGVRTPRSRSLGPNGDLTHAANWNCTVWGVCAGCVAPSTTWAVCWPRSWRVCMWTIAACAGCRAGGRWLRECWLCARSSVSCAWNARPHAYHCAVRCTNHLRLAVAAGAGVHEMCVACGRTSGFWVTQQSCGRV